MRSLLRPLGVIALGLSPAILISACGDGDDETANTPVVPIDETSYVVKEPATTTTTLAPADSVEGGISAVEQLYTIVAGDAVSAIASRFGITMEELANYNEWPEGVGHPIYAGDEIRIPPGSKIPSAAEADEDDEDADTTDGTDAETESTDAETESTDAPPSGSGDDCEAGKHTITADDTTRLKVAEKYDVTVEALDAANVNTAGYSGFYPGLEIVIPCVGD
ncbi:MAG TPA: LysM peptidoglycan-binding domain-containing protein [Ilumatobacteraceae bacterium]|nr:LysM peptidoglycan-binding domain-containing protein [Ilumatobacteraceae bacterium]